MKYLHQALIITAITFFSEILKVILPFPFPASIYGLILMFTLLKTRILKLSQVEDVGGLLLELMPLLLVPASVSFLTCLDTIQQMLLPVLITGLAGTTVVMFVTGRVTQFFIRRRKGAAK